MPTEEAGYTYAVEPTATNRLLANGEESIYGPLVSPPSCYSFDNEIFKLKPNLV
jgi:hypothetical protein